MSEGSQSVSPRGRTTKSAAAFRTISEVADELDLPQHVLRFWETKFGQVKPLKRGGGRRYYRPEDIILLRRIRDLLYSDGYTIRGVQKLLRESGLRAVIENKAGAAPAAAEGPAKAEAKPAAAADPLAGKRKELEGLLAELADLRSLLDQRR
jgi:DNA-binding transcriptional MerR regulator